jgi:hypothetical protein
MNPPRRKDYERKSTRMRPPADAADLRRIVWILERANASGKPPDIVTHSPDPPTATRCGTTSRS